jgi:hypothetical protein
MHYVITYRDPVKDETVTLRARKVYDSPLGLSFLAIADFVFDTGTRLIDPAEEALRERLRDVRTLHLSIYRVLSILEVGVDHEGLRLGHDRSNLVVFPTGRPGG